MIDVVSELTELMDSCGWSRRLIQYCAGGTGAQWEKDY